MVFESSGIDRLVEWKKFRDQIEVSKTPFEDVVNFWSQSPFVEDYLNPYHHASWPDAWHLIHSDNLDDLAIVLCMLYTLKLTSRFMSDKFEVHMSMSPSKEHQRFFLIINDKKVLNYVWRCVVDVENLGKTQTMLLWAT